MLLSAFPRSVLVLLCVSLSISSSVFAQDNGFIKRISDPDLYYATESRNYPESPNTLFVTMRGGGVKVFDISQPAELKVMSHWVTDRAVEGQDRFNDLLVVAELGRG